KVTHLKKGDRVALEPIFTETFRTCPDCKAGRYELCPSIKFVVTPPFVSIPLPSNVSLKEEAVIEPRSMVQIMARIGGMKARLNISICGSGPVRLLAQSAAKALDARMIIAVDIQVRQARFGDCRSSQREERIAYSRRVAGIMKEELKVADKGLEGIDLPVDCTEACTQTVYLAKDGGTYVQVGMASSLSRWCPSLAILTKEVTANGSLRSDLLVEPVIDLVARALVDLKSLEIQRYKFKDATRAFE
ncbi:hypothetical protein BT69DRAFT_1202609, partial [Atractiella rhizophila]